VSKTYLPYQPTQSFLLPPSPLDWLPEDHLARFVLDTVAVLDLSEIFSYYDREVRGYPPHHPMMMVALLLYAYCVGVPSSRKIERRTHEDIAFRVIAGNTHPDHTRISEFRRIHLRALTKLFVQVLRLCQKMGLVKLGHVALDGTKIKANASKHKAMSHERMIKDTARLEAEVEKLLQAAEQADVDEDREHGKGRRGDELPVELRRREGRLARIRALQADLVAEAQLQAHQRQAAQSEDAQAEAVVGEMNNIRAAKQVGDRPDDQDPPSSGAPTTTVPEPMPEHQVPVGKDGAPTAKAQRNFTDADSRIMKTGDGFIQGYNAQAMVDEEHQIIVAADVSNQCPDAEHLIPMLDRTIDNCQAVPQKMSSDTGYFSEANVVRAQSRGVDAYIATKRQKHGDQREPAGAEPPSGESDLKAQMRSKLATPEGARVYSRRKVIAEPPFGQIKNRGFRSFLLRGIEKVRGEWSLIALSHNLLKLHKATRQGPAMGTCVLVAA
jgi:transposase